MTDGHDDEEQASTRFNADSYRVLPCFVLPDGDLRLHGPDGPPLPRATRNGEFTTEQLASIMRHTIPVPGSLVRGHDERHQLPGEWTKVRLLDDLIALYHRVDDTGMVQPARVGDRRFKLDGDLGLVEPGRGDLP